MLLIPSDAVVEAIPITVSIIQLVVTDPSQLTAQDAVKLANRHVTFDGETECHRVMATIQRAAIKGNREVEVGITIPSTLTLLTSLGYGLIKRSYISYTVTW